MSPPDRRPALGLVLGHLPTYLGDEHDVFTTARGALGQACDDVGARLVIEDEPVVDRAGAAAAGRRLVDAGVDAVVLCHATFTMGEVTDALVSAGHRLVHWALEEPRHRDDIPLNGFVSAHLGAGIEHRASGDHVRWLYGLDPTWFVERLGRLVAALRIDRAVRGACVGLVGGIAPGFDTFAVDHDRLEKRLGVRVSEHDLRDPVRRGAASSDAAVADVAGAMRDAALRGSRVDVADLDANARLHLGLAELAAEHGHDALAVSDWPECQELLDIHPGAALTWLEERGLPAACEGDVLGAVTMLALRAASGAGAALLDVATVHPPTESALLWHCGGSPLSLAGPDGAAWVPHSTLGRKVAGARTPGVVADLVFGSGPVTVARLDRDGERLTVLEADVVDGPDVGFDGTRGWVSDFVLDGRPASLLDVVDHLIGRAVDHHVVLTPGHHGEALRAWAVWAGIDVD